MIGSRWRLVDWQSDGSGDIHVSTVVLSEDESREQLHAEATLHSMAGWVVTEGLDSIVCRRLDSGLVRTVSRVRFDPMEDTHAV